jgi:ALG3 protein
MCSPGLAAGLLAAHLLLLAAFAQQRWTGSQGLAGVLQSFWARRHLGGWQRPGVTLHGTSGTGSIGTASAPTENSIGDRRHAGEKVTAGGGAADGGSIAPGIAATKAAGNGSLAAAGSSMTTAEAVWIVWTGNFIGIVCARTLHYQFYSWYCHSLPFLLWSTGLQTWQRLAIWVAIEVVWNVYPPTAASSLLLLTCHCVLLMALWRRPTHL